MPMPAITPVILCGGSGTRLWPLSRKSYPKQFAPLLEPESLLQQTVRRFDDPAYGPPLILTGEPFRFIVSSQIEAAGAEGAVILIEPAARNTAPAALAAALFAQAQDPEALILIAPSDHRIPDTAAFHAAVALGAPVAQGGKIVTFGIRPDRPETGYGYLELAEGIGQVDEGHGAVPVRRFVEKPDQATAESMSTSGRHLWNGGLFLCRADTLIAAFEAHAPEFLPPVRAALSGAVPDLGFHRLAAAPWEGVPTLSIDYAVMERATNLVAVPFAGGWSDLGGWDAIWTGSEKDAHGTVTSGGATSIDCDNSLLRSDSEGVELVGLGLKNTIAVAMDDAVLVADMSRAQDVRLAVDALRARKAPQAEQLPQYHRPWGWYESLALGDRFQVKRIVVRPGGVLSLQSHVHRAEHWVVVEGTARVTVGEEVSLLSENSSIYVPLGAVHRLENPGKLPLVLIEVQTGSYLGEDDIVRYEDVYDRT